jgi:hypothetical protein
MRFPAFFSGLILTPLSAFAELTWTGPNQPDEDTLVLYHFDESGSSITDHGPQGLNLSAAQSSALVSEPSDWMASPAGGYLFPVGNGMESTGILQNVQVKEVDFNKGLTVSFWCRSVDGEIQSGEIFQMENPRVRVAVDDYGVKSNGRLRLEAPGLMEGDKPPMVEFGPHAIWRHVAVVYDPKNQAADDGGAWSLYLDGTLVGSIEDPNDLSKSHQFTLRVGGNTFNNGQLQGVQLDEFLITNRVLTDFSAPSTRP